MDTSTWAASVHQGLERVAIGECSSPASPLVVLLHGFMGMAEDLAPFARSLKLDARFVFPEAPVDLAPRGLRGRAWWAIDVDARADALARGPRDLSGFEPEGIDEARARVGDLLDELGRTEGPRPLFLGGFSQGAMLACDLALRSPRPLAGLVFFSGARIAADQWRPLYSGRAGLRIFMSHGRADHDLAFHAAETLHADLEGAAWKVTWCPFEGGHEIPLVVWREFKRWLASSP